MQLKLFQNLHRLRMVNDVCPLPGFLTHDPFVWKGITANSVAPVIEHKNGYTVTAVQNTFITWHRTFTKDLLVPNLSAQSFIHIHEWIPPTHPPKTPGFFPFSMNHLEAIAMVTPSASNDWSTQARRHLAATRKNTALKFRFGTINEIEKMLPTSQVPPSLHPVFLDLAKRHIVAHKQDVEVLIATIDENVIAGFVAGYCAEASESSYLVGCFTGDGGKTHAMVRLVAWWFERCLDRNIAHANFGDIVGPHPFPFDDMIGYSNFKTHFNIHRVWLPGCQWRVTFDFSFIKKLLFSRKH
ncbi:MAG: hypothetical protein WCT28_04340 [Patescibacteria group bacterium]|jgi:hypothetical protein